MPNIVAGSFTVLDLNSKEILFSKKDKKEREIASLTKIMSCLVVLRLIDRFQLNPNKEKIKVSKFASTIIGTSGNLKHNDFLTVEDLLHGLMLPRYLFI